jgi:hypothetical protein
MNKKVFDAMMTEVSKVFENYGVDGWSLETEEYERQQLIYLGLYEDDEGNYGDECED